MNGRAPALALWACVSLLCVSVAGFSACGGNGDQKNQAAATADALPTVTTEQLSEMRAIPDLGCESCPAKAEVERDEELSASDAREAIDANADSSDLYAQAEKLGYHDVLQGLKTTYTDGTVVNSALIQGEEDAAILATSTGSITGSILIRLDPENADQLVVTDAQGGSATVTWEGKLLDSQETHNSCHYWHCVGAAVSWLYTSTWYAWLIGDICEECSNSANEYVCGLCLATLPSGLLASTADCAIDSCDFCDDDSCGDRVFKSRTCRVDPSTIGEGRTQIYDLYETWDEYTCLNPGDGDSQCVTNNNVETMVQVCPGNCGADGASCAVATPHACDPTACGARSTVSSAPTCHYRHVMRWSWYELWWTGRTWSCQPDGAGGSVCVPGPEGWQYRGCPHGWGCSAGTCTPPTATPTRTGTPTRTITPTRTVTATPGPTATKTRAPRATSPFQRK